MNTGSRASRRAGALTYQNNLYAIRLSNFFYFFLANIERKEFAHLRERVLFYCLGNGQEGLPAVFDLLEKGYSPAEVKKLRFT
jgi:hypothetical protein